MFKIHVFMSQDDWDIVAIEMWEDGNLIKESGLRYSGKLATTLEIESHTQANVIFSYLSFDLLADAS